MTRLPAFFRLLVIGSFLLTTSTSHATKFIMRPTQAHAMYSDTANWENRAYPGITLAETDTIYLFKGASDSIYLDLAIDCRGFILIEDSVRLIIMHSLSMKSNSSADLMYDGKISAKPGTYVRIDGSLGCFWSNASFGGTVEVNGTVRCDAEFNFIYGLWQSFYADSLKINGRFTGTALKLGGTLLELNHGCYFTVSSGYHYEAGWVRFSKISNKANVRFTDETPIYADILENDGTMEGRIMAGHLDNALNAQVLIPMRYGSLSMASVVNDGILSLIGENGSTLSIGSLINDGQCLLPDKVFILDSCINHGTFSITQGNSVASILGRFYNNGVFTVHSPIAFATTEAINDSLMVVQPATEHMAEGAVISGHFLNRGTLKVYGKMTVLGWFLNEGMVQQLAPQ